MDSSVWAPVVGERVTLPEGGEVGEVIALGVDEGEPVAEVAWPEGHAIRYRFNEIRPSVARPAAAPEPVKAPGVSRARGTCSTCREDSALTADGLVRVHGPLHSRCSGSGQPPRAEGSPLFASPSQPLDELPVPATKVAGAPQLAQEPPPGDEAAASTDAPADSDGEPSPCTVAPVGPDASGPRLAALLSRLLPTGATLEALEPAGWLLSYRGHRWTAGELRLTIEQVLDSAAQARDAAACPDQGEQSEIHLLVGELEREREAADQAIHARQIAEAARRRVEKGLSAALKLIHTLGKMATL